MQLKSIYTLAILIFSIKAFAVYNTETSGDSLLFFKITSKRNQLLENIEKENFDDAEIIVGELWESQDSGGQFLSVKEYLLSSYWLNNYDEILQITHNQPAYPFAEIDEFSTIFNILSLHSHINILHLFQELESYKNNAEFNKLQDLLIVLVYANHTEKPFNTKYPFDKFSNAKVSYPKEIEGYLSKKSSINQKKTINANPTNAIRIDFIFPGIIIEKKLFKDVTIKTGFAMGLRILDSKTHPTINYELETRFYLDCYCRDKQFKFCGEYFAFSFQNIIQTNGALPSQEYLFYGGISGKLFWKVYGEIGFGFGVVSEGGKGYPLISLPGSIGVIL